jgi:FlaA1/EpsC-like NDP-sugar epimerase
MRTLLKRRRAGIVCAHLGAILASGGIAFLLRFDFSIPPAYQAHLRIALMVWAVAKLASFLLLGLHHGLWRYVSVYDLLRISAGNAIGSVIGAAGIVYLAPPGFPRSIWLLDLFLCTVFITAIRVTAWASAGLGAGRSSNGADRKRTLIYGAGDAGVALLREIRQNSSLPYHVIGFVDDDPLKVSMRIQGTRVYAASDLENVRLGQGVEIILIAIPSANGAQMTRILRQCHLAGVPFKTVPSLGDVIEGAGLVRQIRDVAVEDLLGRSPVRLDGDRIRETLAGRVVLVTGAAGSIGSELCRQIARFRPKALVGLEISESSLFFLDREMQRRFPDVPFYPEIGSIQSPARLAEVFAQYSPSVVYHAAAYKHVPLMETHVFEAVENNVFGTCNVAQAAIEHGVREFVLISSDKAVRPTSIMGATKRLAELVVMSLRGRGPKFVAVRFGNVLGSNGSVIPIFQQQIAEGGPLTVTHPEMRRYFMTIPEASQLVLQATTMGSGGEVFVLDMGKPVKVVDLATNLILLSGLRPGVDIQIEFTGIRPGEKLYEELSSIMESTVPTGHEKISTFIGEALSERSVAAHLTALHKICATRDIGRLTLALKESMPEYSPSTYVLRRALDTRPARSFAASAD